MRYFPAAPVTCKKIFYKWQVFEQRGSVFRLYVKNAEYLRQFFFGAFAKQLRKGSILIHPRATNSAPTGRILRETWYLKIFRKYVQKIHVSLKFDKHNGCFRWKHMYIYRGADNSLARPGRKQARKHVRVARDLKKIVMRAVIKFLSLQGKAPNEIHAILTETLICFLPGRAKDLSAPLYINISMNSYWI